MKIRKNYVQLNETDVLDALTQYALNAYQGKNGTVKPGSVKIDVSLYRSSSVGAVVRLIKRPQKMPAWAQELRERLKPLYKDKGELYCNRRKDYIGVKLYCPCGPINLAQAEEIIWEVCYRHNKYVTKVQPYLFHVWDNVPAHLQKPVLGEA